MKAIWVIAMLLLFAGTAALAQENNTPVVDQRQQNQRARIRNGVASGELTRRETAQSVRDQRRVRRAERRAKADGEVTDQERVRLQRQQNKASRQLRRNKHDAQDRPRAN